MKSKIQAYMDEHGLKITWLADKTGIAYNTLYKYVRYGLQFAPDDDRDKVIEALGVELEEVM